MNYRGLRTTIWGLGHFGGGLAAARWLAHEGAQVTVTDQAGPDVLADSLAQLADVPIAAYHLGGHRAEDFLEADLIVVNPAVHPTSPWLHQARSGRARFVTELELFIENCRAPIVGVTGSNGKSTTAAMTASILESAGRRVFLGGNLGGSLLDRLSTIGPDDWVVLEISSFQLWHFSPTVRMPHVAVVTGCTPNHLDWHPSLSDYVAAKQRMFLEQTRQDFAVLNPYDAATAGWTPIVRGEWVAVPELDPLPTLQVPGLHNRINAACAAAAARAAGCKPSDIRQGLERFRGLPQRLQWFATVDGRRFYNDSTATTPESTLAALRSLDGPIWLVAGGKNKGFCFRPLAEEIVARARGAALFGSVRDELFQLLQDLAPTFPVAAMETMAEATRWCWSRSMPNDAIVLSPACASTDQFRNFQQRGRQFELLVHNTLNGPHGNAPS
ncbi:MAG: UDP-N-acetylmuramoyl-L-alanine--D-glutamate ligase [Planctomycetaceae bacterium]|nr:UDP-N-acetylmuramoyl-L-alanine--D-glutamate ligase [Planctomycetaceae bacterium]